MNLPERAEPVALDARQQIQRRRMSNHLQHAVRARANSPLGQYARMVANRTDWTIVEQPERELPYALSQLITVDLRDQGNALIEETRQLNNRFGGRTYFDLIMFLPQPFPAPTVSGTASSVPARPPIAAPWRPCRRGG